MLVESVDRLKAFAAELEAWSNGCVDARMWGGPTMYPAFPLVPGNHHDEARASQLAKDINAILANL